MFGKLAPAAVTLRCLNARDCYTRVVPWPMQLAIRFIILWLISQFKPLFRMTNCFPRVFALIVGWSAAALGQTMTYTPQWLPAASGNGPITISLSDPSPETLELMYGGNIAVRWNGTILPAQVQLVPEGASSQVPPITFTVPSQMRVPGITEFVLWNTALNQATAYEGWVSVIIPTQATIFEADPTSDRVVAFVGADGTPTGTGGAVSSPLGLFPKRLPSPPRREYWHSRSIPITLGLQRMKHKGSSRV
jgi:hypothetical protein